MAARCVPARHGHESSYNSSISACEKAGQWIVAVALLELEAKDLSPDVATWMQHGVSFNSSISACEKSNHWVYALCLLLSMEDFELCPDIVSYSGVISAAEKGRAPACGQWVVALALLDDLERRSQQADVIVYSAAKPDREWTSRISACEKGRKWELALALLMRMDSLRRRSEPVESSRVPGFPPVAYALLLHLGSAGLRLDAVTYSATMASLVAWSQGLHLLQLMAIRQGPFFSDHQLYGSRPLGTLNDHGCRAVGMFTSMAVAVGPRLGRGSPRFRPIS
eukprot:Skav201356  [mRNA]  locus=scaffold2643:182664:188365:- [translate_table: standard]